MYDHFDYSRIPTQQPVAFSCLYLNWIVNISFETCPSASHVISNLCWLGEPSWFGCGMPLRHTGCHELTNIIRR